MLRLALELIKNILAPPLCAHCKAAGSFLCANCFEQIEYTLFSNQEAESVMGDQKQLDKVLTVGPFFGVIKSLLLQLKYQGIKEISQTLAELTYHSLDIPPVDLITCVPAHHERLQKRRFNQSALIANKLAQLLKKPYVDMLERTTQLASQASIDNKLLRQQRQFMTMALLPSVPKPSVTTMKVLLVDDVYTTGATLTEAARALKTLPGISAVIGLTVARA